MHALFAFFLVGLPRLLKARRGLILFAAFMGAFWSFVLARIWQPIPEYEALAQIQINPDGVEAADAPDLYAVISHPVILRTAETLGMLEGATSLADTIYVVQDLQFRLDLHQQYPTGMYETGYSDFVDIRATHTNPLLARNIANTVAARYAEYHAEIENRQLTLNRQLLTEQVQYSRRQLEVFLTEHDASADDLPPLRKLALERETRALWERVEWFEEKLLETHARERRLQLQPHVVLVRAAITPGFPNNPYNPVQRAVLGGLAGLVLGCLIAVVAHFRGRYREREDLSG